MSRFGQLHSSRTDLAGDIRHGCRRQRNRRDNLNLNPHQNNTENYGMDEGKNCDGSSRDNYLRGRSQHNHLHLFFGERASRRIASGIAC